MCFHQTIRLLMLFLVGERERERSDGDPFGLNNEAGSQVCSLWCSVFSFYACLVFVLNSPPLGGIYAEKRHRWEFFTAGLNRCITRWDPQNFS